MTHIERITSTQIISRLPDLRLYADTTDVLQGADLLVCAAGFEARARAVVSARPALRPKSLVIVTYPTNEEDNAVSLKALREFVAEKKRQEIKYERGTFRRELRAAFVRYTTKKSLSVVVDVSGMSSFVFYCIYSVIAEHLSHCRLCIFYAEAGTYYPSEDEWKDFKASLDNPTDLLHIAEQYEKVNFQSRGVDATYESPVFAGRNVCGLPTAVVAIPNFSLERMKSMLSYAERMYTGARDRSHWLLGAPPNREKNGWRLDALAELFDVTKVGVPVSTLDYRDIIRVLEDIWETGFTANHLVIATLGSKMQHIGTALFLGMHPEVGLILSEPKYFESRRFSEEVGNLWWLDLGSVRDLQKLLASRGTLEFRWSQSNTQ